MDPYTYGNDRKLDDKKMEDLFGGDYSNLLSYIDDKINPRDAVDKGNGIMIYKRTSNDVKIPKDKKRLILSALSRKGININFLKELQENQLIIPFSEFLYLKN